MPPNSQFNPNNTNPFGNVGLAEGVSPSGPNVEPRPGLGVGPQPRPSTISQPEPQASADSSNGQALGWPNKLPLPKKTSPHQKITVHFAVLVAIIAAVVAFLVIVGALLAGRKRRKIRVRITTEYEC